jgi:hypothetical protein
MPRVNRKVLGREKYEVEEKIKGEFVGLKAKMCAYELEEKGEMDKNVKKCAVNKELTLFNRKSCLCGQQELYNEMNPIRSYKH